MSGYLKSKFLRICPYGKQYLEQLVKDCRVKMLWLSVLSVVILCLWNSMFALGSVSFLLESMMLALYCISVEVPNHLLQERENKVYQELLIYFSRVKHRYIACHHMANAILDAADGMQYEIQKLAEEMYRVLVESERKEKVREYILYHKTNRYLKLFLIQAYEVSEKGDNFFSENVEHLRLELMEELYRRKKRAYEFAGYAFVAVAPFFAMPVVRQWGMEFTPELEFFYAGTGVLLETVTFAVTVIIYSIILQAKEIVLFTGTEEKKIWTMDGLYEISWISSIVQRFEAMEGTISDKIRKLLVQSGERISFGRICFQMSSIAVISFIVLSGFCMGTHQRERKTVLERIDAIESIAPAVSEENQKMLAEYILEVTKQCRKENSYTEEQVQELLREKIRIGNESMEQAAVQEIMKKLEQYRKARLSVGELLLCLVLGTGISLFPLIKLHFQVQTISSGAVYEVRQFQFILLMERKLQGITVIGLLEDMEVFSRCFRTCLRRCINSYGAGPKEALLRLKEDGCLLQESFEELADAFLSVDEVGVELAFAEVESNLRLLEKMTQLEAEISIERKKDNTDFIARIPMILTVGVYFILPFFSYSLQGVYEVFELLEEMQM